MASVIIDVSASIIYNDSTKAAANATVIQNALNNVSTLTYVQVQVNTPGVYYCNQVVMPTNTSFLLGYGVTHRKPANYNLCMFINKGALQSTPVGDSNIGFFGQGAIDGNAASQTSLTQAVSVITPNTFLYGIQGEISMINVKNFECAVANPYNTNGFFCQYIGTDGYFHDMNPNVERDFIHINGPSKHIVVDRCSGFSNDAFIALNAWDWHRSSPTVGDIVDVRINDCAYYGCTGLAGQTRTSSLVVFLPGTRTTGNGTGTGNVRNVSVDGWEVNMSTAPGTPASPGFAITGDFDQVNGSEYSGVGLVENVRITRGYYAMTNANCRMMVVQKTPSGSPADGQNTLTVRNVVVEQVHCDASVGTNGNIAVSIQVPYNTFNLDGVKFKDCEWTPSNLSSNQAFVQFGNKTVARQVIIDGLTINSSGATAPTAACFINQYSAGNAAVIDDLTLDRIMTAQGYQIPQAWFLLSGGVNDFRSRGNNIVGPNGGADGQGIYLVANTAYIGYGVVSDGYFNGVKAGVQINNASAGGVTLEWRDCKILNQTHPIFMNGAFTANISYVGGMLSTGANLVRNVSGATTLSLFGTTVSGTGAQAVTVVSGTVRITKSDLAPITASGAVLTPQNNDVVNFAGTPSYTGAVVQGGGTGAGMYIYRGTGATGWVKVN
ncbi:hypothetical protein PMI06_009617 [Burkholderia sp. BT03]|nr:hypothetical protein PMI06_009617 [Burkholderia sp. BT03]